MRRVLSAVSLAMFCAAGVATAEPERAASQTRSATYIGCLRAQDDGTFVLTEVGGMDVPETRNWRSLFMTTERTLDVVGKSDELRPHAGQTVRITGMRDGRSLDARSVVMVGATCK
jgi:hypothetical protein